MKLVICEKPSVGAAVAAALGVREKKDGYIEGNGYVISWCIGHLVGLAEAAAYGEQYKKWSYDSLPILPQPWQYTVFKDRQKQFKILKDLMRRSDVSEVVNACDAGREGELIFRLVYHAAGCDKPFSRLWISSMEKSAIKKGFAELKPGEAYDALYASALCRAKADWIIGINATRLFSVLHGKTLTVGRVQTPTLKMLADRDGSAFASSIVGIMAWWSDTFLLSRVRDTSGLKDTSCINGSFPQSSAAIFAAVPPMSSVRNALSVLG